MQNQENYDINRPWLTLDPWQTEYIFNKEVFDNFLLCGRQVGKTTAMSQRAVELCVNHFKKGEFVLINSITEKQAYLMLAKALVYAKVKHPKSYIPKGDKKPTKHILNFKNGTGILCYAAGDTGEGLRGYTIKKLMIDEGSRMSEEYYIAVGPMMSVIDGSTDIASTPAGKLHPEDGSEKFFYKCSKDDNFKKVYVSAEDCPRHSKEFLEKQKTRMSKLAYAQEYLAVFTDELKRLYDDKLIEKICVLDKTGHQRDREYYLGVDIAGLGEDECAYEILEKLQGKEVAQKESQTARRKRTTETTSKIQNLHSNWDFKKIGVDDGGVGFGVWSELMEDFRTKKKTVALNNASRHIDREGKKSKRILKEEMYINLLVYMEQDKIKLLNDDEVIASLASIQHDEGKIFGSNSHITEGIIRALWLIENSKNINTWIKSIKI